MNNTQKKILWILWTSCLIWLNFFWTVYAEDSEIDTSTQSSTENSSSESDDNKPEFISQEEFIKKHTPTTSSNVRVKPKVKKIPKSQIDKNWNLVKEVDNNTTQYKPIHSPLWLNAKREYIACDEWIKYDEYHNKTHSITKTTSDCEYVWAKHSKIPYYTQELLEDIIAKRKSELLAEKMAERVKAQQKDEPKIEELSSESTTAVEIITKTPDKVIETTEVVIVKPKSTWWFNFAKTDEEKNMDLSEKKIVTTTKTVIKWEESVSQWALTSIFTAPKPSKERQEEAQRILNNNNAGSWVTNSTSSTNSDESITTWNIGSTEEQSTEVKQKKKRFEVRNDKIVLQESGDEDLEQQLSKVLVFIGEDSEHPEDEEEIELSSASEIEEEEEIVLDKSELFPDLWLDPEMEEFTQKILLAKVSNVIYSTPIEFDRLDLSAWYLSKAINKFIIKKQILEIDWYRFLWLKDDEYYNWAVAELFESFRWEVSFNQSRETIAQDISDLTFSLSSYVDEDFTDSSRHVFRTKFISDLQKLQKHYTTLVEKDRRMKSFFSKKAKRTRTVEKIKSVIPIKETIELKNDITEGINIIKEALD